MAPCDVIQTYRELGEVGNVTSTTYLRPRDLQQAAVDSLRQPSTLFQITSAETHALNIRGLKEVLDVLRDPANARLFFVVPPPLLDSFRLEGKKELSSAVRQGHLPLLCMYVLQIEYEFL